MTTSVQYSLEVIKEEARQLTRKGILSRCQPIFILCRHFPTREWEQIECELERHDFLLRDQIGDLLAAEEWIED
jgi:hypothetical protein